MPTCKGCNSRFQLLIKETDEGKFRSKTAPLPTKRKPPEETKPNSESTVASLLPATGMAATKTMGSTTSLNSIESAAETAADVDATGETKQSQGATAFAGKRSTSGSAPTGKLGPYRLLKLLGEGGMGSVFLARQTTLDRNVALKVVKSNLSKNKSMLARFTREAYAAAQLIHPNVVQIYDMGDDQGNCYFSMELVDGQSLSELIHQQKKLDPEQATSFILHAARGLQCAHDAGMVHRDIKPANLLVNRDGLVKVADLGLVKVPDKEEIESDVDEATALSASLNLTRAGGKLGTPYYMAPEQAKSSINVDHRADIYSLGCTFYVLLTGKKPFEGNSVEEVVSKHSSAPLIEPSKLVERVPTELSAIVSKMMAKRPDDRYQSMGELIAELENHLGISSTATFTPDESDADLIEQSATIFNSSSLAKLRGLLPLALVAGSMLLAFVMIFVSWRWATGFLLLPVFAFMGYFIINGVRETSPLFSRTRQLVIQSGWLSWLKWAAAGMLLVVASFLVGSFIHWTVLGGLGVVLGVSFFFLIDVPIANARKDSIFNAEVLLRRMRLKGMDESTLQMFVAKYAGNQWEEFFESLFGYDAKRRIRAEIVKSNLGKKKPKFRPWRDGICDSLQLRIEAMHHTDDQKHLQKVEQAGLVEQGVSASDAKEQAAQMALALVDHADSISVAALEKRIANLDPETRRSQQRAKVKAILADAKSGKYRKPPTVMQKIRPVLNRVLGSYPRFLLGCCLIVGCLMWANENELFSVDDLRKAATEAGNAIGDVADAPLENVSGELAPIGNQIVGSFNKDSKPLSFPLLGNVFYNFNSLIAGLILAGSAIVFGWRMAIFVLPAAAIVLWGPSIGIPELFSVKHLNTTSALIGVGLFVLGILFGRSEK